MNRLPGYLLMLCAVLLLLSAIMLIFSLAVIIRMHLRQYGTPYLVRQGAFILVQLLSSFLLFRYGRRLVRRSK